jgi:hypothetical protein
MLELLSNTVSMAASVRRSAALVTATVNASFGPVLVPAGMGRLLPVCAFSLSMDRAFDDRKWTSA